MLLYGGDTLAQEFPFREQTMADLRPPLAVGIYGGSNFDRLHSRLIIPPTALKQVSARVTQTVGYSVGALVEVPLTGILYGVGRVGLSTSTNNFVYTLQEPVSFPSGDGYRQSVTSAMRTVYADMGFQLYLLPMIVFEVGLNTAITSLTQNSAAELLGSTLSTAPLAQLTNEAQASQLLLRAFTGVALDITILRRYPGDPAGTLSLSFFARIYGGITNVSKTHDTEPVEGICGVGIKIRPALFGQ